MGRESLRFVGRRLVWGLGVVWLTLTVSFVVLWLLPDYRIVGFARVDMGLAAADADSGGFLDGYLEWMGRFLLLDWGQSVYYEKPVVDVFADRLPVTLAYLVPGLVVGTAVGIGATTYGATDRESYLHRGLSGTAALGLGVPAFLAAWGFWVVMPTELGWTYVYNPDLGVAATQNLLRLQIPGAIIALGFVAIQVGHAQSETVEHLGMEYVKTARAKGAGRLRVARHILRNAWPSMASLAQGEALGMLLLSVIAVEYVLDIPGAGTAMFYGFASGDPMLSFAAVFGMVVVGVAVTLARDFLRLLLDPKYGG